MAKFYGVGVGPGDRKLLTLKAVEILNKVDVVLAPSKGEGSIAYFIAKPYIKGEVVFLDFPMTYDTKRLKDKWEENAEKIRELLMGGKDVAFITIGDPMIYSTYIYLLRELEGFEIETIPGISSYSAAAASFNLPIAEGRQNFAVVSSDDPEEIEKILELFDTVVLMKVSRNYDTIIKLLKDKGFVGNLAIKCGHEDEKKTRNLEEFIGKKLDYLSLIIAKKEK
ncbi:MAG: precorrin-2 C(20)-methyltransferase [Caldanaerobacter sp.]|uniref:precorrin-2 C(20)-methyltransferase n=1 Tax=Caldanaerobacter sp. TaxID=2930036 RepID=UPI003C78527B